LNPSIETLLALAAILTLAHTIETCLGFGSTVTALSLGAFLFPVETLLPALVMVGILQSSWLLMRGVRHVDWKWILGAVLPVAAAGLGIGIFLRDHASEAAMLGSLGTFITVVAALELVRLARGDSTPGNPSPAATLGLLVAGGIFQGLFASGGPPIVYCAARRFTDPAAFRATLAVLWLLLNSILCASMGWSGKVDMESAELALAALPGFLAGAAIGGRLRPRRETFQLATWSLLLVIGIAQSWRAASHFAE